MLFQELLLAAAGGETITLGRRAFAEIAKSAEIAVFLRLKEKHLDFVHRRTEPAFGDDVLDDAATRAPQLVQPVNPRDPYREINILAFMGDRQAQLLVGVLVTVMQKVPLSKPLKYHDKSHKKSVTH